MFVIQAGHRCIYFDFVHIYEGNGGHRSIMNNCSITICRNSNRCYYYVVSVSLLCHRVRYCLVMCYVMVHYQLFNCQSSKEPFTGIIDALWMLWISRTSTCTMSRQDCDVICGLVPNYKAGVSPPIFGG